MFIERSVARIRAVRTLFVLACLLPTLGLVGWSLYRRSSLYSDPLTAGWSQALGLAVTVESMQNVRPAVMRLREVGILNELGRPLARVSVAELEQRSDGVIVSLPTLLLDEAAVSEAARLSLAWLTEPVRFPAGGAVQVDALSWGRGEEQHPLGGFRVEYVVVDAGRAIRVRREPADADELRVRALAGSDGRRLEVELNCERGLPAELVAAATGGMPGFGDSATLRGSFRATADATRQGRFAWSGVGEAVVAGVDLSGLAAVVGQRAEGEGVLRIEALGLEAGRITSARFVLSAEDGAIGRGLLERLVTVFGCRLGPAGGAASVDRDWLAGPPVGFDEAALAVELTRTGLTLRPAGNPVAALVTVAGQSLLEAGSGSISYDRFAWLFAPNRQGVIPAAIPASEQAVEVLSHLPNALEAPESRF
jgi:hypothetical protein